MQNKHAFVIMLVTYTEIVVESDIHCMKLKVFL